MERYPSELEPGRTAENVDNQASTPPISPRRRDIVTKMSNARADDWGVTPAETTAEPAEPYTIYTHPGLMHYSSEELETGEVESRDWELLRLLENQ